MMFTDILDAEKIAPEIVNQKVVFIKINDQSNSWFWWKGKKQEDRYYR